MEGGRESGKGGEEGGYFMDHFRYWGLPVARRQTDSRGGGCLQDGRGRDAEDRGRRKTGELSRSRPRALRSSSISLLCQKEKADSGDGSSDEHERERERETHSTDICSELHPHQGARRLQTGGSEWPFSAASRAMPSVHSFSYKAPSHSRMMPRSLGRNIEREMETSPRWGFQKGHGLSCGERKRERMVGGWEGGLNERE